MQVPTISIIESMAPTSWKWTWDLSMPWALASASPMMSKIPRAFFLIFSFRFEELIIFSISSRFL